MYTKKTTPSVDASKHHGGFTSPKAPPAHIIDAEGQYKNGWFRQFNHTPNTTQSAAPKSRLQFWFHLHCESDTHYFSANVAQMGLVANVSLVVICKETGACTHSSKKHWLWNNQVKQTGGCALIWDPISKSCVSQDNTGQIEFCFHTDEHSFFGTAEPTIGPPFVQSTSLSSGYGSLQWWGPIRFTNAVFTHGEKSIPIQQGSLGGFDRTIGHRTRKQHWNWLSAQGMAQGENDESLPFALQLAVNHLRPEALPDPKKYNVWIDSRLFKFDTVRFIPGAQWEIVGQGAWSAEKLSLRFQPTWCRHEKSGHPAIFGGHFKQYYGQLLGSMTIQGKRYGIETSFALVEDSRLNI